MPSNRDFCGHVSCVKCVLQKPCECDGGCVTGEGESSTIVSAGGVSERERKCLLDNGVDGRLVRLHRVDGHGMGRTILPLRLSCLTGNQRVREVARAVLEGE